MFVDPLGSRPEARVARRADPLRQRSSLSPPASAQARPNQNSKDVRKLGEMVLPNFLTLLFIYGLPGSGSALDVETSSGQCLPTRNMHNLAVELAGRLAAWAAWPVCGQQE
jgi:hypothetical protein